MNRGVTLYGIIADLRREHPTPAAMQTLDMVVAELGRTRDNLKEAVEALSAKSIPPGGKGVLDELVGGLATRTSTTSTMGWTLTIGPRWSPLTKGRWASGFCLASSR